MIFWGSGYLTSHHSYTKKLMTLNSLLPLLISINKFGFDFKSWFDLGSDLIWFSIAIWSNNFVIFLFIVFKEFQVRNFQPRKSFVLKPLVLFHICLSSHFNLQIHVRVSSFFSNFLFQFISNERLCSRILTLFLQRNLNVISLLHYLKSSFEIETTCISVFLDYALPLSQVLWFVYY